MTHDESLALGTALIKEGIPAFGIGTVYVEENRTDFQVYIHNTEHAFPVTSLEMAHRIMAYEGMTIKEVADKEGIGVLCMHRKVPPYLEDTISSLIDTLDRIIHVQEESDHA